MSNKKCSWPIGKKTFKINNQNNVIFETAQLNSIYMHFTIVLTRVVYEHYEIYPFLFIF